MSEVTVKKYVVRLSKDERSALEDLISKGKHPATTILKARVLLKADVSDAGEGWSDSRIVKALDTSVATLARIRQRLVEDGLDAVLTHKQKFGPQARLRRCRGGQTDRAGLFGTSQGAVPLDIGTAGRQGRGTEDR